MLGEGGEPWQTWAHELGHNLGFWDFYWQPDYDTHYNSDVRRCSRAGASWRRARTADHPESWHKHNIGWITSFSDVVAPPMGATETHTFTLIPLERKFSDYPGFGSASEPAAQLVRIKLSAQHWVHLENRQPGATFSQLLPDDVFGWSPANAGGEAGGLLVTDTVDPNAPFFYRPAVTAPESRRLGLPAGRHGAAGARDEGRRFAGSEEPPTRPTTGSMSRSWARCRARPASPKRSRSRSRAARGTSSISRSGRGTRRTSTPRPTSGSTGRGTATKTTQRLGSAARKRRSRCTGTRTARS